MPALQHRCLNHVAREAVARCPECGQFFCRECVTEHAGRVVCSRCLQRLTTRPATRALRWDWITNPVFLLLGLFTAWFVFRLLGAVLLQLPAEWHDGTVWQQLAD